MYTYKPKGVCTKEILFDVNNGKLTDVQFIGGCDGNLKGIGSLVEGMDARDALSRLRGITCGRKSTSCPDQLAKAIEEYLGLSN